MATISGKRFQITDGASSPTNLFPYTVTEAVYGLSTVIANAISAFQQTLGSMAYETATNYVSLSGTQTITGQKTFTGDVLLNANNPTLVFRNSSGNFGRLYMKATDGPFYRIDAAWANEYQIYDSGNFLANTNYVVPTMTGLSTEANILSNTLKVYSGRGGSWTGSIASMAYAGILAFGEPTRGFQMWASYGTSNLYWRNGNATGTAWGDARIIWDTNNAGSTSVPWACSTLTVQGDAGFSGNLAIGAGKRLRFNGTGGVTYSFDIDAYQYGGLYIKSAYSAATGVIIDNSGNVGIGNVSSPSQKLHVVGNILSTGDQVISSDINLKENLAPVTYSVEDIAKTRAVTFDWKDGRGKSAGSIAQDWKPLIPELVHGEEGNMTLAYGQIALVNTILLAKHETEQDKEIKKLKKRVRDLEKQLNIS